MSDRAKEIQAYKNAIYKAQIQNATQRAAALTIKQQQQTFELQKQKHATEQKQQQFFESKKQRSQARPQIRPQQQQPHVAQRCEAKRIAALAVRQQHRIPLGSMSPYTLDPSAQDQQKLEPIEQPILEPKNGHDQIKHATRATNQFDVHAYTETFRSRVPTVEPYLRNLVTRGELVMLVRQFIRFADRTLCEQGCLCRTALNTILGPIMKLAESDETADKLDAADNQTCCLYDPDLGPSVDIRTLLARCIDYALDFGEIKTLHETLHEIGGTCIQGESHRLLFLYMAWLKLY